MFIAWLDIETLTKAEIDKKNNLDWCYSRYPNVAIGDTLSSHVREITAHHFPSHNRDGDEFDGEQL